MINWRYKDMQLRNTLYGAVIAAAIGLGCGEKARENTTSTATIGAEGSIELKVNRDELKKIHADNYKANAQRNIDYWTSEAFKDAKEGDLWDSIRTDLRLAQRYADEAGMEFNINEGRLKDVYQIGVREHGVDNVKYWVNKAFKDAKEGEFWDQIETDLRLAQKYAEEADLKLEQVVDNNSLQQLYAQYKR